MSKYRCLARFWQRHLSRALPFRWLLAFYNPVATPGLVIRRARRLGLPTLRHCEDYFFLLRYCKPGVRVRYLDADLSCIHRQPGTTGGLSGSVWRMRKGEFVARSALLKEGTFSGAARYVMGVAAGLARLAADLARGRYSR